MSELMALLGEGGATRLGGLAGLEVYPRSVVERDGTLYFLGRQGNVHRLGLLKESAGAEGFSLQWRPVSLGGRSLQLGIVAWVLPRPGTSGRSALPRGLLRSWPSNPSARWSALSERPMK